MTTRGKLVFTILFLAIVGIGVVKWWPQIKPVSEEQKQKEKAAEVAKEKEAVVAAKKEANAKVASMLVDTKTEVPKLDAPAAYRSKDNIVDLELSVYPGYAGIIAANGGLEPNENSIFAKKYGFKVRIKLSEEESWSALNSGKMAASATTVDVLAVYGRQFNVTVPVQIGFSRGADGVVVKTDIKRVNDLKGKILASSQFTESDFFIRYLAQEAGIAVNMMASLDAKPDPEAVNLVYAADAFAACDAFSGSDGKISGCVTWEPKTSDAVKESGGKAQILTTNRNLLIVADILVVNKGFAAAEPEKVKGLVAGILEGNQLVNNSPDGQLDIIAKAFSTKDEPWDRAKAKSEIAKIHFSNGPENLAFFSGSISAAGSFSGIYQSAVYSYGTELVKNPVDSDRFADTQHLKALETAGAFAGQTVSIQPITTKSASLEPNPLLSKDVRFFFDPDSPTLSPKDEAMNTKNLKAIKQMLDVSPGSRVLLRGHVDPSNIEEFRKKGGESLVRTLSLKATELSKQRANEIRRLLIEQEKIPADRLEALGRGWDEPATKDRTKNDLNRRVEAQWFTLE
jgi:NitT/TauT family transport system substrate-binding protein